LVDVGDREYLRLLTRQISDGRNGFDGKERTGQVKETEAIVGRKATEGDNIFSSFLLLPLTSGARGEKPMQYHATVPFCARGAAYARQSGGVSLCHYARAALVK
jgi:hypothetical protein